MSLYDRLSAPSVDEQKYAPSIEFDARGATISTGTIEAAPGQPPEYAEILRSVGRDPDRFRLAEILYEKHWEVGARELLRTDSGEPLLDSSGKAVYGDLRRHWLASYKLRVEPIDGDAPNDLEALIRDAHANAAAQADGGYWFVFQAGDLQLGKVSRDGSTADIIDTYIGSVERAVEQLRRSTHLGIAGVQISMPGDCIEGVVSQGGRNAWLTQETITEQTRLLRRLMLETVDAFRFAPAVELTVVNGNHDQANRQWNTYPGDGWATEAAIALDDAMKLNTAAYGHVNVRIPEKWSGSLTVPIGDTVVTVVHGHQFRQRHNAMRWWADQAVHNQPAGAAQVLQAGHFHTWAVEGHATKTVVISPTYDCGSDWYRESRGAESKRGGLAYLLRAGDVSRMSVV